MNYMSTQDKGLQRESILLQLTGALVKYHGVAIGNYYFLFKQRSNLWG